MEGSTIRAKHDDSCRDDAVTIASSAGGSRADDDDDEDDDDDDEDEDENEDEDVGLRSSRCVAVLRFSRFVFSSSRFKFLSSFFSGDRQSAT
jgi:hypothetical protein